MIKHHSNRNITKNEMAGNEKLKYFNVNIIIINMVIQRHSVVKTVFLLFLLNNCYINSEFEYNLIFLTPLFVNF